MKNKSLTIFALLLVTSNLSFLTFFSGCAASSSRLKLGETAGGEVVDAEGLAAVTGDLLAVKRAALSDAKRDAVEKVLGVLISAKTLVDKAITIEQKIYGKTDGYVKKYEITKEGKEADGIYHTKIRALVSFQEVKDDLQASEILKEPAVGNPRVAILLDETIEGSEEQSTACSDAISQGLLEKGYKVVDRSELAAIRVAEATKDLLEGRQEKALKQIIQKLNAEVVITGKATASKIDASQLLSSGLISFRGSLTAKAIKAQTGDILASVSVQGSGLDATKEAAAQKALAQLGKNAANDLSSKVASELARRSTVLVTVRGIPDINRLSDVKNLLSKTAGVGDLYMRSFSEGTAELEIKINSATSADLANVLTKETSLNAQVLSQTQDSLEVKIQ